MVNNLRHRRRLGVEARRHELLVAGSQAFATQPFDEVSIEAVARRAGASKALVYHYFGSKRGYYISIVRDASEQLLEIIRTDPADELSKRLERAVASYLEFAAERPEAFRILVAAGVGFDAEVAQIVNSTRERIVALLEVALGQSFGVEGRTALWGWIGFVEAVISRWLDTRSPDQVGIVRLLVRALQAIEADI